ncbi:bifunctional 2-C-methyl-D-erythritol 4-phosphate cytidylyltransferase/2-C-methyl-D-erythritol 2,4-cyclodiphosphate synthase [Parvularcula flava]|uniref:Bifunctional enzyme IspD/IspF n=1 Tax=Aquisalinus luteolus TaxID=1566827 RepID=A0A8J3ER32_9PROT|nr:bifunctional 2-C-methyl-D-erythritol 4-phosphate cytidylyltransferase/2-C-methyl-D-erythritol 2,4-cyclodiphosphate synthase [Aquisalinus luteolus]NHK27664.1 bifunctional 2-C-methyl-D-erythritol 4-phosphate cytidylyltransferase/2-C-methyl-D-erythritol 2,4-cyclodiphosphate synthase [Aquisalinus luteolus]GGH96125.1 bifunctional enzyme IspD/IspF [Aquisalinus luteolus]
MKTAAIIVAAGKGIRAGSPTPKQYQSIAGRPVLAWSVERFLARSDIDAVLCVIADGAEALYRTAVSDLKNKKLLPPCTGGATRQASVHNGLKALAGQGFTHVLVHDAARPGLDDDTLDRLTAALETQDGALAALPVNDTLKAGDEADQITKTVDRTGLWAAQTPQAFAFDRLLAAHKQFANTEVTDDAALAELAGIEVRLVPGTVRNMKITRPEDFAIVERLLMETTYEFRTGHGYDVHAFEPGDHVILCGVKIPHTAKLKGHSDADAGMHALTDALFGAIGLGDIGDHFPPSDPQWKGAASEVFLKKAVSEVIARGGTITHCDITLICENPKIGPHRNAMRNALAEIMNVAPDRISVKATTTEKLGFTGREEGLAAMATATVRLPETL